MEQKEKSNVNHPTHYNQGKYEAIDVIEDWKLNFNLGNAVKYIARCRFKRNKIEDLEKAVWYIEREIKNTKKDISSEETCVLKTYSLKEWQEMLKEERK